MNITVSRYYDDLENFTRDNGFMAVLNIVLRVKAVILDPLFREEVDGIGVSVKEHCRCIFRFTESGWCCWCAAFLCLHRSGNPLCWYSLFQNISGCSCLSVGGCISDNN